MDTNKFLEDILHEWSYRLSDGTPNLNNPAHIVELRKVVGEQGLPDEFVEEFMNNIHAQKDGTVVETSATGSFIVKPEAETPKPEPEEPIEDEPEAEETPDDEPPTEKKLESYFFDADKMKIIKTGNTVKKTEILLENKYKCFLTGEVYCEIRKSANMVKLADLE